MQPRCKRRRGTTFSKRINVSIRVPVPVEWSGVLQDSAFQKIFSSFGQKTNSSFNHDVAENDVAEGRKAFYRWGGVNKGSRHRPTFVHPL